MKEDWSHCKNILVIRADNMGDVLMSVPAIRALKETFNAKITLLTSSMGGAIARLIEEIDEVMIFDLPWVKCNHYNPPQLIHNVVEDIRKKNFDAAVIFTVFSQNPLPAAMLAYLAQVPKRLSYCRENPYELLTNWVPDKEPYVSIQHQVLRDLNLVNQVGAFTSNTSLSVNVSKQAWRQVQDILQETGIDLTREWVIFHAPVSERKRCYPARQWVKAAQQMTQEQGWQVLFTGSKSEQKLTDKLAQWTGCNAFSLGGKFNLEQFIALVQHAPLVVSVNTGTIHIAAAVQTPVVVLYAQTNPQHTPWKTPCINLYFGVPETLRSKNEVIQHLYKTIYSQQANMPSPAEIVKAGVQLFSKKTTPLIEKHSV